MKIDEFLLVNDAASARSVFGNPIRAWASQGKLEVYGHPVDNYRPFMKGEFEAILEQNKNSALIHSVRMATQAAVIPLTHAN